MTNISARDYFAGQALAAFVASGYTDVRGVALRCYQLADALLAVRDAKTYAPAAETIPADVATNRGGLTATD